MINTSRKKRICQYLFFENYLYTNPTPHTVRTREGMRQNDFILNIRYYMGKIHISDTTSFKCPNTSTRNEVRSKSYEGSVDPYKICFIN